jgi:hypothetical protein
MAAVTTMSSTRLEEEKRRARRLWPEARSRREAAPVSAQMATALAMIETKYLGEGRGGEGRGGEVRGGWY